MDKQVIDVLGALVKSSEVGNKTNLAILSTLEKLANQQPTIQDSSELVAQFTKAMEGAKVNDLVPVKVVSDRPLDTFDREKSVYTKEKIVEKGKQYTRHTHPLLFAVVDYLETNQEIRNLGSRKIAKQFTIDTGRKVGKTWTALAKKYWESNYQDNENVL